MTTFLKFLTILFFVLLNAFFVAAEFALVRVRSSRLDERVAEGVWRARIARSVHHHLDAYLSACQVGITLASLGLGWVGEPFLARVLFPVFGSLGIGSETFVHTFSFVLAFGIITYLHIVVGEMAPKSFAIRYPDATALWTSPPLRAFYIALYPFIWFLNESALFILRILGVQPVAEGDMGYSEEEIRAIVAQSHRLGILTVHERRLLENVLSFSDKAARQIMVPRTAIVYLSSDQTLSEALGVIEKNPFTRYPLCDGDLDHVIGMVHVRDVYIFLRQHGGATPITKLRRDILTLPESVHLDRLLAEFRRSNTHMAILVDEYGGTAGLATLEDVVEELVGEIYDEFDVVSPFIRRIGPLSFVIEGLCPIEECEERLGVQLPRVDEEIETVGGLLFSLIGHLPKPGERAIFQQGELVAERVEGQRIANVRLVLRPQRASGQAGSPSGLEADGSARRGRGVEKKGA